MSGSDFWSRRRAAVADEEAAQAKASEDADVAEQAGQLAKKTDEEVLKELGLPDPDDMQPGDDFSGFLAKAVPDRIRTRALRKLWRGNPVLANLDGLIDYGEDFTDSATVIEDMQTAYQVGKGMLRHVVEMAEKDGEDDAAEASEITEEIGLKSEPIADSPEPPTPSEAVQVEVEENENTAEVTENMKKNYAHRGRMRYSFSSAGGNDLTGRKA